MKIEMVKRMDERVQRKLVRMAFLIVIALAVWFAGAA